MTATDRREFLSRTGKFLLLTGTAAAALEHVLAGSASAAPGYASRGVLIHGRVVRLRAPEYSDAPNERS